jgi:hypothetical protein
MLQNRCLDRETVMQFYSLLHPSLDTKFDVEYKFDRALSFLKMEVEKLPVLSEGQTLLKFTGDYVEEICRAAIACNIQTVQAVCGAIEYTSFEPAKVLPLLILNEKLQAS